MPGNLGWHHIINFAFMVSWGRGANNLFTPIYSVYSSILFCYMTTESTQTMSFIYAAS